MKYSWGYGRNTWAFAVCGEIIRHFEKLRVASKIAPQAV